MLPIRFVLRAALAAAGIAVVMEAAFGQAPAPPPLPYGLSIEERLAAQEAELKELRQQLFSQSEMLQRLPPVDGVMRTSLLKASEKDGDKAKSSDKKSPEARLGDLEKDWKAFKDKEKEKKNEFPTFKTTGFTQLDSAWYSQTPLNIDTVGDAQDGTGFRRARLAVQGKAAELTNYQIEMDFATAGRPSFFDTYVEQLNVPCLETVRCGQFCQPFSVDALTGFRALPFLERALPFLAFVPFRRVGTMSSHLSDDEMSTFAISGYRTGGFNNNPLGDNRSATDFGDIGGYSMSMRGTHLIEYDPHADDRYLWEVGASYNFSQLGANDGIGSGLSGNSGTPRPYYQSRVLPEFGPLGYLENPTVFGSGVNGTPIFVDSGRYEADFFNLFGVETVYQSGPISIQSEWMGTLVESVVGPVFYHGAYGEIMYRLTGEHRVYDKKLAVLKNPIPFTDFIPLGRDGVCGWGAWEVAARFSYVEERNPDKLDGHYYVASTNSFTGTNKAGNGTLYDSTLGVTWFLNQHFKLQANWIHCLLNNEAKGVSNADLFVTRVQVDY